MANEKQIADEVDPEALLPRLFSISKNLRALTAIKLAEVDFAFGQDALLMALEPSETLSVSRVAARTMVRPSTASKSVDRLAEKGLVVRSLDETDVRRRLVVLTPLGIKAKSDIQAIHSKIESDLVNDQGRPSLQEIEKVLAWIEARLINRLGKVR